MVGPRLTPEEFLERSEAEELKKQRGKLKIYLGAAPGVGKTYTMLHDALEKRKEGLDIIVGLVESHGRHEIEEMVKKFEMIPRQSISYRGKTYREFDLDVALKRHPGVILIDEMAHTNAPGLRHEKRWQDIKEFLDRGIDVYTTLNVQHIESLKDDVAQIIQAPVQETVPDSMIEMANTIAVVDLPPEDLLKRLQDGKIYIPEQAAIATVNFFRKGNLIALRELALRTTAERVGTDVLLYRQSEGITRIWPTRGKILVCVGPSRESLKLIRAAKRIVTGLSADWLALYVDTPQKQTLTRNRNIAIQNLRLAEQLGAEAHVVSGFDIVKEIMAFAHEQNVTQIMVRKHVVNRWRGLFHRSLVDELVRQSGEIDIYIMTSDLNSPKEERSLIKKLTPWRAIGLATLLVTLATLFNLALYSFLEGSNLVMVYLLSLVLIARLGHVGLSVVFTCISVVVYQFFFVPPFYSFDIVNMPYALTLLVMLLVGQIISYLTILTRRQAANARLLQYQTTALYTLTRQLIKTRGVDKLLELGCQYINDAFASEVTGLLPVKNHLKIQYSTSNLEHLETKEMSIAQWVYEVGQRAGLGTDTLSFSKALYLPLIGVEGVLGVLRIQPRTQQLLTPEQMTLLESCVHQVGLALEVASFQEKSKKREIKKTTEQAKIALLEAISNDLKAPLKSIVEAQKTLKTFKNESIREISKAMDFEIETINQINNNITRIIQLETNEIELEKVPTSLNIIIHCVIDISKNLLRERTLHTHIPKNLPLVPLNEGLIQQVLFNLLDNAVKFTPLSTPITIDVHQERGDVVVSVEDQGSGVFLDERDKLFEKFYRGKQLTTVRGLGLGLAICHKIIIAHGGHIWVENLEKKGAAFRFSLPLNKD